jgi:uncharacterized membrane protein HdeD (DUF308 family)
MRFLTIVTGILFTAGGVYLVTQEGITFLSVAFAVGILFLAAGLIEVISHNSFRGEGDDGTWVLIDGLTTFVLGALILLGKISQDIVVPQVLGLWVLSTGIRNLAKAWEKLEVRNSYFYDHLFVGLLNLIVGLYVFFNPDIFNLASITLVGICIVVQGLNIANAGITIRIFKPDVIKTRKEKLTDAAKKARDAQIAAREALEAAKAAHTEFKEVALTPAELLDKTLIPNPSEKSEDPLKGLSQKL